MKKIILLSLVFSIAILSGCASIVGQPSQLLPINSSPDGASVSITDEKGYTMFEGVTPASVSLEKSDGTYWGGKSYTVTINKEGYDSVSIPVTTSPNGWYLGGNFIFGGLIGWFIVDPSSGNMYSLSVNEINATLQSQVSAMKIDDGVSIVLLDDVPEELRSKLVKVN